jgi:hypothetical protein
MVFIATKRKSVILDAKGTIIIILSINNRDRERKGMIRLIQGKK